MEHLMVGGPLDGRILRIQPGLDVIHDRDGGGAYVRSPLSDAVTVFHFKPPEPSRWAKRKRAGGFPKPQPAR